MRSSAVFLVVICLLVFGAVGALAQRPCDPGDRPEIAVIKSLQGSVVIIKPSGTQYVAKVGTVLHPDDIVSTGDNSAVEIAIEYAAENGTQVWLGANSKSKFYSDLHCGSDDGTSYYWVTPNTVTVTLLQGTVRANAYEYTAFEILTENVRIGPPEYSGCWEFPTEFEVQFTKGQTNKNAIALDKLDPMTQQMVMSMLIAYGVTSVDQLTLEQQQEIAMLLQLTTGNAPNIVYDMTTKVRVNRGKLSLYNNLIRRSWTDEITVYKGEATEVTGAERPTDPIPF